MHLINTSKLKVEEFGTDMIPLYATLSHRWCAEEITLKDGKKLATGQGEGYEKVRNTCAIAARQGFKYLWVDTCCIDKTSSAELTEAINTMYRWYEESVVCYAYLADVPSGTDPEHLESEWFTRGWTLQELIAPAVVIFLDQTWQEIGTKSSLRSVISRITGIPEGVLEHGDIESASVAQRMSWASTRETTRVEDRAYSLMGIFGVNMPMLYGEGERAFIRLQVEIMKVSDDHSLFAWISAGSHGGFLAPSPAAFMNSGGIIPLDSSTTLSGIITTSNQGIHLRLKLVPLTASRPHVELAILPCTVAGQGRKQVAFYMSAVSETRGCFSRYQSSDWTLVDPSDFSQPGYIEQEVCLRWERRIRKGRSPLTMASEQGNEKVMRLLLDRGVDIEHRDQYGRTPLSKATTQGRSTIVKLLLERGANIESEDRSGRTPLSWAAERGHEAVVRLLLENGANTESKDKIHRRTPVIWAMDSGHIPLVGLLLDKSNERHRDEPFSWIMEQGLGALKLWFSRGHQYDPNNGAKYATSFRFLEMAHDPVVQWLSKMGSFEFQDDFGRTLLSRAAEKGFEKTVMALLEKGVSCESRDQGGRTLLSWAAGQGHARLVKLLLEKGANFESRDQSGRTPLSWAEEEGHEAVMSVLLEKGVVSRLATRSIST